VEIKYIELSLFAKLLYMLNTKLLSYYVWIIFKDSCLM